MFVIHSISLLSGINFTNFNTQCVRACPTDVIDCHYKILPLLLKLNFKNFYLFTLHL